MATCKSLRRTWLYNSHFIWDMMKVVLWTSKNCTLEPLATLFLPGQSSTAVIRERKRSEQKEPSLSLLIPSYLTQPHFLWQSETKDSSKRENGLKAACRTPALQSTSSACVSEAMRAGWDGLTVRAVYMTLFLHLCTYSNTMQISGYKSLLRTVWYFSYEFWSIYINNTYQNKGNCLNKTKPLKNNLF